MRLKRSGSPGRFARFPGSPPSLASSVFHAGSHSWPFASEVLVEPSWPVVVGETAGHENITPVESREFNAADERVLVASGAEDNRGNNPLTILVSRFDALKQPHHFVDRQRKVGGDSATTSA
jgi:hypothetical protein